MKRNLIAASLTIIATVFCFGGCSDANSNRKLQQIGEHTWAYVGTSPMTPANSFGANAGVVIGDQAVLVVDTLISANEGKQLLSDIRKITPLPIRWVVNTHYHLDHAWGNCVFADCGAAIVGTSAAPKLMNERGAYGLAHADKFGLTPADMVGTKLAAATVTFSDSMSIDLGGVSVELRELPHAHCPDNLVVLVPGDKVLFAGDILFVACHPFMGEGNIRGWLANLDAMGAMGMTKIVPGHGPLAGAKDIAEMKEYVKIYDENATKLAAGKTQADAPKIAAELIKLLPAQGRKDMPTMVEYSLRMKYLPQEKPPVSK